jgi:predicted transcriptional regulator
MLALTSLADSETGYTAEPHRENNVDPMVDSSGADAVVPLWAAPPVTLIKYAIATTMVIIFSGAMVPVLGRIQDVLSHDKRKYIYDFICANPGSTIADISANLSINIGTVYHHVWVLELRRKIFFESHGKFVRVYEGRLAASEKKMDRTIYGHIRNDMSRRILHAILRNPGINNVMLSQAVGLDKSTIYWYLQRFKKDELVFMIREGKHKHCFVSDRAKSILEKCVNA